MLTSLCALLLPLQAGLVPLTGPQEVEGQGGIEFGPNGADLFYTHGSGMSRNDALTGEMLSLNPTLRPRGRLIFGPGGSEFYVPVGSNGNIGRFRSDDLTRIETIPSGFDYVSDHYLTPGGSLVVTGSSSGSSFRCRVLELATGALLNEFEIRAWPGSSNDLTALVGDDRTLVHLNRTIFDAEIVAFDVLTGQQTARRALPGFVSYFGDFWGGVRLGPLQQSADRNRLVIRSVESDGSTTTSHLSSFTGPGLMREAGATDDGIAFNGWSLLDGGVAFTESAVGLERWDLTQGQGQLVHPWEGFERRFFNTAGGVLAFSGIEESLVFDPGSGALLGVFPRLGDPFAPFHLQAAVEPSGGRVLIGDGDRVSVIEVDGAQTRTLDSWPFGAPGDGDGPFHIQSVPGEERLVVAAEGSDNLWVIDEGVVTATLDLGRRPIGIEVLGDRWAVVMCRTSETLELVDLETLSVMGQTPLPAAPIELDREGDRLWVRTEGSSYSLIGFDLVSAALVPVNTINLGGGAARTNFFYSRPETVLVDPARHVAYVADADRQLVQRVALPSGQVEAELTLDPSAQDLHLAISPSGARVSVSFNFGLGGQLAMIDDAPGSMTWRWSGNITGGGPVSGGLPEGLYGGSCVFLDEETLFFSLGHGSSDRRIRVSDAVLLGPLPGTLGESSSAWGFLADGNVMLLTDNALGEIKRYDGGPLTRIYETPTMSNSVYRGDVHWDRSASRAIFPGYIIGGGATGDGLWFANLLEEGSTRSCTPAVPNALGLGAEIQATGSALAGDSLSITVTNLAPFSMVGYLLVGDQATSPQVPLGAVGTLCVGGRIGRFVQQVQAANASGALEFSVDSSMLPLSAGAAAVAPGESWTYQAWYRDSVGSVPTSNFSDALSVSYR